MPLITVKPLTLLPLPAHILPTCTFTVSRLFFNTFL